MPGSTVTLHFSLSLTDGTLLPGLELALYGLTAGEEQTLTLTPEQAWGERQQELIKEMPRSDFPADARLEVGQVLSFSLPDGDETLGVLLCQPMKTRYW